MKIVGIGAVVEQTSAHTYTAVCSKSVPCNGCPKDFTLGQITLSFDGNQYSQGHIAKAIEYGVQTGARNVLKSYKDPSYKHDGCSIKLPDFVCVEVPLIRVKNSIF